MLEKRLVRGAWFQVWDAIHRLRNPERVPIFGKTLLEQFHRNIMIRVALHKLVDVSDRVLVNMCRFDCRNG